MRTLFFLCLLCCTALAQPEGDALDHFEAGKAAYRLGELDEAIEEFRWAYRLKPDPAFLYNIALAYRGKENFTQAIFFYRSYLREVPDAPNRAVVEAKIAELERLDAERKRVVESPPRTPLAPKQLPPAMAPTPEPAKVEQGPRIGLLLAGAATGTGGVALTFVGLVLTSRARSTEAKIEQAAAAHDAWNPELAKADASARRQATAGVVCLGLGAVAIAAGGILAYFGVKGSVVPVENGVAVAGTF